MHNIFFVIIVVVWWYCLKAKKQGHWLLCILIIFIGILSVLLFVQPFALTGLFHKAGIIELNKFKSFSGKNGNEYYYTVLIKDPPENTDSLKKLLVRYYLKKAADVAGEDSSAYVGSVFFYRYTRQTAYFIDNDANYGGFSSNSLDMYQDQRIGFIIAHYPCDCDSTKYEDFMEVYDRPRDTLHWECNGKRIDNWSKYK